MERWANRVPQGPESTLDTGTGLSDTNFSMVPAGGGGTGKWIFFRRTAVGSQDWNPLQSCRSYKLEENKKTIRKPSHRGKTHTPFYRGKNRSCKTKQRWLLYTGLKINHVADVLCKIDGGSPSKPSATPGAWKPQKAIGNTAVHRKYSPRDTKGERASWCCPQKTLNITLGKVLSRNRGPSTLEESRISQVPTQN